MEWLSRMPGVGPLVAWAMRTRVWRVYEHLEDRRWSRLAAAITFSSFIALFPLITAIAAFSAAFLGAADRERLEDWIAEQVPGIADQLDLGALFHNAGTVGLIALGLLLLTGLNWISALRGCLRVIWDRDDREGNFLLGRVKDAGVLLGLGGALVISVGVSVTSATAARKSVRALGLDDGGAGLWLLTAAGFAAAVAAGFLLMLYALTRLPGVWPDRRDALVAALIGALGFELLKLLLSGYLSGVASRSVYGAFGVPIALVLWINFMARLLLFCSAWTAAPHQLRQRPEAVDEQDDQGQEED